MDNNYAGIKVLLELKRKRLMDKIGLTYSDSVGTDTLVTEVKNIQDKQSRVTQIKETVKRERENDPLDIVYKRLKTGDDYNSVDFSYEESDKENDKKGAILNVKFDNTSETIQISDGEKSIFTEFLSDSKPEPDSEANDADTANISYESSSSSFSTISKKHVKDFFTEKKIKIIPDVENIESKQLKSPESQQKIHLPISAFENYVTVLRGRFDKANTSLSQTQDDDDLVLEDTGKVNVDRGPGKRPHTVHKGIPDNVFDMIIKNEGKQNKKKYDLQLKKDRLKIAEEKLKKLKENNQEENEKYNEPIQFFNLKKYLSQTFIGNDGLQLVNYSDDSDMVKLVEKSIVIADTFSGHEKLEDQLQLFENLINDDKEFFTISDSEMNLYFEKIISDPEYGRIKNWREYLKLFPHAQIIVPDMGDEEKDMRAYYHYTLNTERHKNLVKLVNLANRVKVLALLQEFPIKDEAETIDTESKSGESREVPLEQDYDGYGIEPPVPGEEGFTIVIDDNYWEYMMAVSPLPDGGGKKTKEVKKNKSKKPKSVSQKKGGFLKGILKNFGSCGCDKKGKSKTKRRNGRNVSFKKKKGKKLGGKRTFRKERKNKKRVRFTIKA